MFNKRIPFVLSLSKYAPAALRHVTRYPPPPELAF